MYIIMDNNVLKDVPVFNGKDFNVWKMGIELLYAKLVVSCTSANEMWDRLNTVHSQKWKTNKVMLQKEFFDLKMKPNEKAQDFFARAENVSSLLTDAGVTLDESTLVAKILSGLSSQYA